jgi:hypothetical protein
MPSTDRKLELKAKTSMAQTASQAAVYAKVLKVGYLKYPYRFHALHRRLLVTLQNYGKYPSLTRSTA